VTHDQAIKIGGEVGSIKSIVQVDGDIYGCFLGHPKAELWDCCLRASCISFSMLCTTSNRSAVAEDEESDDLSGVEVPEINAGTDQIGDVDSCLDRRDDRVNVNVDEACGWFSGGWHGRHPSQDRKCLCLCAFLIARRPPV